MAKKVKVFDILIIDDDKEYCKSLKDVAKNFDILLSDFQNLEDGFKELESSYNYRGLILDGKCLLDHTQETPRDVFITQALRRLERMQIKSERYIPTVINSAYIDELEHILPDDILHFDKGEDNTSMFRYLRDEINNSEEAKIRNTYSTPLEVFKKGYLDSSVEHDFIVTIKNMKNDDSVSINNNLARIRTIIEAVYKKMNNVNKTVVPDQFFESNNVHVRGILKHLSGNLQKDVSGKWLPTTDVYQSPSIKQLVSSIYSITSDEGSHHSENQLTRFAVEGQLNNLCEFLIWFGNWTDEQKAQGNVT